MKIEVKKLLGSEVATFECQGFEVLNEFLDIYKQNIEVPIVVSFKGIKMCTSGFLNVFIGKLYLQEHIPNVDEYIKFEFDNTNNFYAEINKIKMSSITIRETARQA